MTAADGYRSATAAAGGTWYARVSGAVTVDVGADEVAAACSVNKVAVAVAVLTQVDRGHLRLDQRVEVTADLVAADGLFALDGAYPSSVTLGHVLAAMLTVSDDTAVRLCGRVCPAPTVNDLLAEHGFTTTRVAPAGDDPHRYFLGTTTARETHDLFAALAAGRLLSVAGTAFLLAALRSPLAYVEGIRRDLTSTERGRVATKAGWHADRRNEAGVIFDQADRPGLIYALFAKGQPDGHDLGGRHPAVAARARLGPAWLAAVDQLPVTGRTRWNLGGPGNL